MFQVKYYARLHSQQEESYFIHGDNNYSKERLDSMQESIFAYY